MMFPFSHPVVVTRANSMNNIYFKRIPSALMDVIISSVSSSNEETEETGNSSLCMVKFIITAAAVKLKHSVLRKVLRSRKTAQSSGLIINSKYKTH